MAETISYIDPRILKVHPRNAEFFDDVEGAEFERLVESIKDHGVLTPLRVTKDMTIISGHQRTRAAIKAECFNVPVIIDDSGDDNDVLMKLIETNFGRMKNDKVKQAKWLAEYEKLKGVRQGSAESNNFTQRDVTEDDIAKELGVTRQSLQNLKSLLKLDPAIQALISDGKINATTGFKILSKLTPEEQSKLVDKLPTDVKMSAKTVQAEVEKLRRDMVNNTNTVMEKANGLMGENARLTEELKALRDGNGPISPEVQTRIDTLEQERREYYEKFQASSKARDTMQKSIDKLNDEVKRLKSASGGSVDAVVGLEAEIEALNAKFEAEQRRANDLEYELSEKEDEINTLKREKKDGFMRKALRLNETEEEYSQRERDALISSIQIAIGTFQSSAEGFLIQKDTLGKIDKAILSVLIETCSQAINAGNRLKVALMAAGGADVSNNSANDDDLDLGA